MMQVARLVPIAHTHVFNSTCDKAPSGAGVGIVQLQLLSVPRPACPLPGPLHPWGGPRLGCPCATLDSVGAICQNRCFLVASCSCSSVALWFAGISPAFSSHT